jgi:hypothetical protein
MTESNKQQLRNRIESLIDGASLRDVLQAIEHICYLKGGYINENWQDSKTAAPWYNASTTIARYASTLDI